MNEKTNLELLLKKVTERDFIINTEDFKIFDKLNIELDNCKENIFFYVTTSDFVKKYYEKNRTSIWKIKAVFELGFPFYFFHYKNAKNIDKAMKRAILKDCPWILVEFSKETFEDIVLGFNSIEVAAFKNVREENDDQKQKYEEYNSDEYFGIPVLKLNYLRGQYYSDIENYITSGKKPILGKNNFSGLSDFEFNIVLAKDFNLNYIDCIYRYKKSVIDDYGVPSDKEKMVSLSSIVEFLVPENSITKVQEKDIIVDHFFINDSWEISREIHICNKKEESNLFDSIALRSYFVDSYLLYSILKSEFIIDYALRHAEYDCYLFNDVNVKNLMVFIPEKANIKYFIKKYEFENSKEIPIKSKISDEKETKFYDSDAKSLILNDLDELHNCFNQKAYKAAIILAGSILEAFLIDWISDLEEKNFFVTDYMVYDEYRKKERRADLKDYINAIEDLKKPSWFDAAKKATVIRKKRNLVHAKLYIDNQDISKETCTEVIDYLEYVINTRWNIKN